MGLSVFLFGCQPSSSPPSELQGIVELTQRSIAFELPGRVLSVDVARGDLLTSGATIAHLDATLEELHYQSLVAQARATKAELDLLYEGTRPEDIEQIRARVRGAEAEVRAAKRELDRSVQLHANRVISEAELDAVRIRYERAAASQDEARGLLSEMRKGPREQEIRAGEARLQAADASARASEERIARHSLLADGSAEVLDVPVRHGEFVSPGTTVITVAETKEPFVDIFVPQARMDEVRMGMAVTVRSDSVKGALGGRVEHVARTMEYSPRFLFSPKERPYLVLRVRVRISDPERKIHAGVPAFVDLKAPPGGLSLPPAPRERKPEPKPNKSSPSPEKPATEGQK